MAFQSIFGLVIDGVVGPITWERLFREAASGCPSVPQLPPFPGTNLSVGSRGDDVRMVQQAINRLVPAHPGRLWTLTEDGIFGNQTRDAVFTFQDLFGLQITGVVGPATWDALMREAAGVGALEVKGQKSEVREVSGSKSQYNPILGIMLTSLFGRRR